MKINIPAVFRGFGIYQATERAIAKKEGVSFWSKFRAAFNSPVHLNKQPSSERTAKGPLLAGRAVSQCVQLDGDSIIKAALNLHMAKNLISSDSKKEILPHAMPLETLLKEYMEDPGSFMKQWRSRY